MIADSLKNIEFYKGFSKDIYWGLKFISQADEGIKLGTYHINENVNAIVSEYATVACFERGFEAHRHVIDIQYPIVGQERIKWSPLLDLEINTTYDSEKDRTFYLNKSSGGLNIDIGNGIFAIMFPADGHSPQHFIGKSELIKKITVKVKIQQTQFSEKH